MATARWILVAPLLLFVLLFLPQPAVAAGSVHVLTVQGVINPVQARYVAGGIAAANAAGAQVIVIKLDTPGGLDTSMREIVQSILASNVPVIVWVAPGGARAASAGMFITIAAPIAAMAPNTAIGAATPVQSSGETIDGDLRNKAMNDAAAYARDLAERHDRNAEWADRAIREAISATSREAVELRIVDYVAADLDSLLQQANGRTVTTAAGNVTIDVTDASIVNDSMDAVEQLLLVLTDPTIAALLLAIGSLAIYVELQNPGTIVPGVVGVISLIVGLFGLGTLPLNLAALALVVVGLALFGFEAFTASSGILGAGGAISIGIGLLLLVNSSEPYLQVSRPVIAGIVVGLGIGVFVVSWFGARTRRLPVVTGIQALIGTVGVSRSALTPEGMVFVDGELWHAVTDSPVDAGTPVQIVAVDGLTLQVTPATRK